MRISSLIWAAPGGDRAVAIDGPTNKLTGYEPVRLVNRFGKLFGAPDTKVICELKSGELLEFNNVDRFASHVFGVDEIVRVHAIPDLAWEHVKMKNPSLKIQSLLGPYRPSEFRPETEPAPPPLDGDG